MTIVSLVGVKRFVESAMKSGLRHGLACSLASVAVLLLLAYSAAMPQAAFAQASSAQASGGTVTPGASTSEDPGSSTATGDDEFSRQLGALKKTFNDIGKQIEAGTRTIDGMKSPEQGRQGIEDLRGQVSRLLATVADNGEVAKLGQAALERAQSKIAALSQDPRFKPEEREYLVHRWQELKTSTEGAIKDLDSARRDFANLLHTLQTSEDYIDELLQIRAHEKALDVIHQLTTGIRDASDKLKKLLGDLKPPTA